MSAAPVLLGYLLTFCVKAKLWLPKARLIRCILRPKIAVVSTTDRVYSCYLEYRITRLTSQGYTLIDLSVNLPDV